MVCFNGFEFVSWILIGETPGWLLLLSVVALRFSFGCFCKGQPVSTIDHRRGGRVCKLHVTRTSSIARATACRGTTAVFDS